MPKHKNPHSYIIVTRWAAREKKIKSIRGGRFKLTGGNEHSHSITEKYPHVSTNQNQQKDYINFLEKNGPKVEPPKAKYRIRTHNKQYTKLMQERREALKTSNALCSSTIKAIKEIRTARNISPQTNEWLKQKLLTAKADEIKFIQAEQFFLKKNPKRTDHKLAAGRIGFLKKNLGKIKNELLILCQRDEIITQKTFNELTEILGYAPKELHQGEWPKQPFKGGWKRHT